MFWLTAPCLSCTFTYSLINWNYILKHTGSKGAIGFWNAVRYFQFKSEMHSKSKQHSGTEFAIQNFGPENFSHLLVVNHYHRENMVMVHL